MSTNASTSLSDFPIPLLATSFPTSTAVRGNVLLFPGVSDESTQAIRRLLEENDRRFHIYQAVSYKYNHLPHHLLAAYSLGASPSHLQSIFDADVPDMAPLERSMVEGGDAVLKNPPVVHEGNWWDAKMLGNTKYYAAYLQFFHQSVNTLGPKKTFENYILSDEANAGPPTATKPPRMFIRFLTGAFHPFIQTGCGIEFHDRVVFAEGLAQTAVQSPDILAQLFEPGWPSADESSLSQSAMSAVKDTLENLTVQVIPFFQVNPQGPQHLSTGGPSLLELYAELCASPVCDPGPFGPHTLITARMQAVLQDGRSEEMRRIGSQWVLSAGFTQSQWEDCYEEIAVLTTLLACSTSRPGGDLSVDFFLLHCLTSSIFLPSLANLLSPADRVTLLRSYFLVILHISLCRGRPHILPETMLEQTPFSSRPTSEATNDIKLQIVGYSSVPEGGNSWLTVVRNAMYAQDSHVLKAIRALLHYSTLYGQQPCGSLIGAHKSGSDTEAIPGVSKLGGDIFQRAAGIIMQQTGWVRERGSRVSHRSPN